MQFMFESGIKPRITDPKLEDETIRQLSNNKIKVKKGKKDGNNSK